jgi:hypothetical protein
LAFFFISIYHKEIYSCHASTFLLRCIGGTTFNRKWAKAHPNFKSFCNLVLKLNIFNYTLQFKVYFIWNTCFAPKKKLRSFPSVIKWGIRSTIFLLNSSHVPCIIFHWIMPFTCRHFCNGNSHFGGKKNSVHAIQV